MRSARMRTCAGDSSPHTSSTGCRAASRASAMVVSVDLPMPGSPPIRISEPGTSPPPSTRSNSSMPVGSRSWRVASTSASGCGLRTWPVCLTAALRGRARGLLDHRRPGAAARTAPVPLGLGGAALLAGELGLGGEHRTGQTTARTGRSGGEALGFRHARDRHHGHRRPGRCRPPRAPAARTRCRRGARAAGRLFAQPRRSVGLARPAEGRAAVPVHPRRRRGRHHRCRRRRCRRGPDRVPGRPQSGALLRYLRALRGR